MSAVETTRKAGRPYDPAARKRGKRQGRQRGCEVYIPAEVLIAAGFDPNEPPPFYLLSRGHAHGRNTGRVIVNLYREP